MATQVESIVFPPLVVHNKRTLEQQRTASQEASAILQQLEDERLAKEAAEAEVQRLKALAEARVQREQRQREYEEKCKRDAAKLKAFLALKERFGGYVLKTASALLGNAPFDEALWEKKMSEVEWELEWGRIARDYNLNTRFFLHFAHCDHWLNPVVGTPHEFFCIQESKKEGMAGNCYYESDRGCPFCAKTKRQCRTPIVDGVDERKHSLQATAHAIGERVAQNWNNRFNHGFLAAYRAYIHFLLKEKLVLDMDRFKSLVEKQKTPDQVLAEINTELSKHTKRVAVREDYVWPRI